MVEDPSVVATVIADLQREFPGLAVDGWRPSVQGAVGHVIGVHDASGSRYVLKIYPPAAAGRLDTELLALTLLGDVAGATVPRPLTHGAGPAGTSGFLLMTRLDGVRWADRRAVMTPEETALLTSEVGRTLRLLHSRRGPAFGQLLDGDESWPSSWASVEARSARLLDEYARAGGPRELSCRVAEFVHDHRPAWSSGPAPVLCHNDFIGGNLLVSDGADPRIVGIVDLERATWDDPCSDLAQTRLHVRQHNPAGTSVLTDGYGIDGADEHERLDVYEVLHALRERTWIVHDRPQGWAESVAALDAFITDRT